MLHFVAKTFSLTFIIILLFVAATFLHTLFVSQQFETAERPERLAAGRVASPQDALYARFSLDAQKMCGRVRLDDETSLLPFAKCVARQPNRVFCTSQDSKEFAMLVSAIVAKIEMGIGQTLYFSEKPTLHQKQLSEQFIQDRQSEYRQLLTATDSLVKRGDLNTKDFGRISHPDIRTIMAKSRDQFVNCTDTL